MVDTKAVIALPRAALVIPIGPDTAPRIASADSISPAIGQQPLVGQLRRLEPDGARRTREQVDQAREVLRRLGDDPARLAVDWSESRARDQLDAALADFVTTSAPRTSRGGTS